ncbi:hypothetical protein GQX74_011186 [Glossina fuscipes]|nr:hypothetical protein GQX74_011186 [Glossina fuscipes]
MNTNCEDPLPLGHERMRCELNVHPESIHSLVTSQSLHISFLRASTERNRQADCFKILRWLPVYVYIIASSIRIFLLDCGYPMQTPQVVTALRKEMNPHGHNVCCVVTWFSSSSTFYQFPLY